MIDIINYILNLIWSIFKRFDIIFFEDKHFFKLILGEIIWVVYTYITKISITRNNYIFIFNL